MRLADYEAEFRRVRSGPPGRVYVTYGPEGYLRRAFRAALAERIAPGPAADWSVTTVDGAVTGPDAVAGLLETAPFFGDGRLVIVVEPPGLAAGRGSGGDGGQDVPAGPPDGGDGSPEVAGARGEAGAAPGGADHGSADARGPAAGGDWAALVRAVPAHATLLLETAAPRLDGRTRLGRAVKAVATCVECGHLGDGDAARWVRSELARRRRAAPSEWIWALVQRAGTDLFRLRTELDKVLAYAGDRDRLEPGDLEVVSAAGEDSVFDLVDAIGGGDGGRAMTLVRTLLARGEPPLRLMGMLARQVRLIWAAVEAGPVDDRRLGEALGVPPFVARKYRAQGARFDVSTLEAALLRLADADLALKTGRMDAALAVELLVAELAAAEAAQPFAAPNA